MQLTKDDVKSSRQIGTRLEDADLEYIHKKHLDFSKFQQVATFYDDYRYGGKKMFDLQKDYPIVYQKWREYRDGIGICSITVDNGSSTTASWMD